MQRCSEFQFQSKTLYRKIFAGIFATLLLFSINSQTYGDEHNFVYDEYYDDYYAWENHGREILESGAAKVIETDEMIFHIGKDSTIRVTHIISGDAWGPDKPKLIKTLPGKHSNLQLTDEDGDYLRPWGYVGETIEEVEYIIAGQKPFKAYDLHASYDLENYLELSDDGLWQKAFSFPHDVMMYFDDEIELIFVNSRPVDITEAEGINCVGCYMTLDFFDKPELITKTIVKNENKLEEISNTGEEFVVEILSDGEVSNVNFIDELNYLGFNTNKEDQLFALKIPLDLLLSPYHVYVTEFDQETLLEKDQVRKTEYKQTETHANLSFRPMGEGVVHIVGSNQMEHEEFLKKIQKQVPQPIVEDKTDSNTINENQELKEEMHVEQLYDSWGNSNSNINNSVDNTIIFVIIGIIAAIIIGVIIKLKKN